LSVKNFNKSKKRAVISVAYIVLILLTLAFIFHNSSVSVEQSDAQSNKVVNLVRPIVDPDNAVKDWQFSIFIRKMAHIVEYMVLGTELAVLAFHASSGFKLSNLVYISFAGVMAANLDELIQIYSERGSSVLDVFIDFLGLAVGFAVGYALSFGVGAICRAAARRRVYNKI